MALVTHFDLELHQMDIKTVFLNDDIEEIIYMVQTRKLCVKRPKENSLQIKKIHL